MDYLRIGANAFSGSWKIPIRLNGTTKGIIALEELVCSILLVAKRAYSPLETPRIDHVFHLLSVAKDIMKSVPLTFMYLDDALHALETLPQKYTRANICKTAALVSGLFAQTLGLLEFIDQHGGRTVSKLVLWDQLYLRGIAEKVGSSHLFTTLGITSLGGLKNALTITSSVSTIAHAILNFRRKQDKYATKIILIIRRVDGELSAQRERNWAISGLYQEIKAEKRTLYILRAANEICKITSVFMMGSMATMPVLCFGVVSAVLLVAQEVYKRSILDKKKEVHALLLQ